jgi:hypothetical protein
MMDQSMLHSLAKGSSKKAKAPKHLKTFHAKEQHDGKYHVVRHSGKPTEQAMEHTADNMSDVHAALEDHMGQPNEGEAEMAPQAPGTQPLATAPEGVQ